jgi:hypothetical protein
MKNITLSQDFFFGGKAIFTVENTNTGDHVTYKIKITKPTPKFRFPSTLLSQMTGTDNENHYSYVGKVNRKEWAERASGKVHPKGSLDLTTGSKFVDGSQQVIRGRWIIDHIVNGKQIPDHLNIRHAGKCGRCGRTLTTPESLNRGIGPECWGIMHPTYSEGGEE